MGYFVGVGGDFIMNSHDWSCSHEYFEIDPSFHSEEHLQKCRCALTLIEAVNYPVVLSVEGMLEYAADKELPPDIPVILHLQHCIALLEFKKTPPYTGAYQRHLKG